jgi:RHS repeat-associated protein
VPPDVGSYSYAGTGYANPHAVTQIANGVSTTTYSYDNNGNVTQKTTDGVTTTYEWDYANRLIALGVGGATTTYGYDAFGGRVLQTGTSTTNIYPFKWYSIASSTVSGAKYSTTTEYIFNKDSLVSTIDQQISYGAATGTAQTSYIHPDHLGSTNVITNASGTVASTKDYYPFGSVRVNSGSASLARGYIGEFSDQSNLSYLNARYMEPSRGQFLSQEPIYLAIGDANQVAQLSKFDQQIYLNDPQQLNSYSYARNNPIARKDANGKQFTDFNGSYVVPVFGFLPIGPTVGVQITPSGDSSMYLGVTLASRIGGGGSVTYTPTGVPSEGFSGSLAYFPYGGKGAGGQVSVSFPDFERSYAGGIGTEGRNVSLVYTMHVDKSPYFGGTPSYVSTSMTNRSTIFTGGSSQL